MRDPASTTAITSSSLEVIAQEIVEDLRAALDEFAAVAEALQLAKAEREGRAADT